MAGTQTIYLGTVLWDNTYSDVVNFESKEQRFNYFTTRETHGGRGFNPLPLSRPFVEDEGVVVVGYSYFHVMEHPNYMLVRTETVLAGGSSITHEFFAFIIDVQPDSEDTVIITFEKDYWQSNLFTGFTQRKSAMNIRNAFVIREHRDRWEDTAVYINGKYRYKPKRTHIHEGLETGRFIQNSAVAINTDE